MDKKRKIKLEQLKKRQKSPATPILVNGDELIGSLEEKINKFAKTIDTPITIDNIDDLIDKLSTVPILTSAVKGLTEAVKSIKAPNYPDKIELDGMGEVINLFKQNDSKKLIEDNSKQIKAIIEALDSMSEVVSKNEAKTAPEDYVPFRRVVKIGNKLVFDDNPTSVSRGGGSSIDTSSLATNANQTNGSHKTQIVDAGGEVATVTGGKLDVNATLAGTVSTESIYYTPMVDDTSTANVTYIGNAIPGSSTANAVWQIKKLNTSSGIVGSWADGNALFDNVWDNRTSLTYV